MGVGRACETNRRSTCTNICSIVYRFGEETLTGNCSLGQLTSIGFNQQQTNGMMLKKTYVDSGFLSGKINRTEIYIRSDGRIAHE